MSVRSNNVFMPKQQQKHISFTATKIVSKPTKVVFRTSDGKVVDFKAKKDVPKSVKIEFYAKKKK